MLDFIAALHDVLPPPAGGGSIIDWESVERRFGWSFPSDYRSFIALYGKGAIGDSLNIDSPPFADYPFDDHLLFDVEPRASSNFLLWGTNEGADDFLWNCGDPDPDRWTVRVETRSRGPFDFDMGMVEFIVRLLREDITVPLDARPAGPPFTYESWRENYRRICGDD